MFEILCTGVVCCSLVNTGSDSTGGGMTFNAETGDDNEDDDDTDCELPLVCSW